jgi:hypothetical protein
MSNIFLRTPLSNILRIVSIDRDHISHPYKSTNVSKIINKERGWIYSMHLRNKCRKSWSGNPAGREQHGD